MYNTRGPDPHRIHLDGAIHEISCIPAAVLRTSRVAITGAKKQNHPKLLQPEKVPAQ